LEKDFTLRRHCSSENINAAFEKAARQRLMKQQPPPVLARIEGDLPHAVRLGQPLSVIIHGYAASPLGQLVGVEIRVGVRRAAGSFQGVPRPHAIAAIGAVCQVADQLFCGFAIAWHGTADKVGVLPVAVRFRLAGSDRRKFTRWVHAGKIAIERPVVRTRIGRSALVAIAMATYNPKPELLRAQIDSIRAQTLTDWRLVVSDESSNEQAREAIRRIVGADPRISLESGPHLGFVGNFERALSRLDRRSSFFALSDQDDVWYPAKLQTLVEAIEREKAALVYGGMRIVAEDGRIVDPSFFSWRRPHGHSVDELILVNTVTGAATLARMDLLTSALPIPRYATIYHDMWLALVAAHTGGVVYVDVTLQDYVQHAGNVLGQSAHRDKQAARHFAQERNILDSINRVIEGGHLPTGTAGMKVVGTQFLRAAQVWPEALQRAFLLLSLHHRTGGKILSEPLSLSALDGIFAHEVRRPKASDARAFLNIPRWLAAGSRTLTFVNTGRLFLSRC